MRGLWGKQKARADRLEPGVTTLTSFGGALDQAPFC